MKKQCPSVYAPYGRSGSWTRWFCIRASGHDGSHRGHGAQWREVGATDARDGYLVREPCTIPLADAEAERTAR
jgi:hypothetical protein